MSEVYIDWSKAPEGCTHAYVGDPSAWVEGSPRGDGYWELFENGELFEYDGGEWLFTMRADDSDMAFRAARPTTKDCTTPPVTQGEIEFFDKVFIAHYSTATLSIRTVDVAGQVASEAVKVRREALKRLNNPEVSS
jgi:hypothetical protein